MISLSSDSFTGATRLIPTCDMPQSYVRHVSFMYTTTKPWLCSIDAIANVFLLLMRLLMCVRHDSVICATWRIHTCDVTHSYVQQQHMCNNNICATNTTNVPQQQHVCHNNNKCATTTTNVPQQQHMCNNNNKCATTTYVLQQQKMCHSNIWWPINTQTHISQYITYPWTRTHVI